MFRAGLHLDAGAYASYGLNPTPQSPIGSECVDVKGEISHPTPNCNSINGIRKGGSLTQEMRPLVWFN